MLDIVVAPTAIPRRDRPSTKSKEVVELTFLVLHDQLEALEVLAAMEGISVGMLLRRLVRARLEHESQRVDAVHSSR